MSESAARLVDAARKARKEAARARRLANAQTGDDVVGMLRAYAGKLDQDAFCFEQQAAQLVETVTGTQRIAVELRALSDDAQAQVQSLLTTLRKEA